MRLSSHIVVLPGFAYLSVNMFFNVSGNTVIGPSDILFSFFDNSQNAFALIPPSKETHSPFKAMNFVFFPLLTVIFPVEIPVSSGAYFTKNGVMLRLPFS